MEARMRRPVLPALAALAVLLLAVSPAMAVPPSPNHHVIDTRGRHPVVINHFGNPALGQARCSAQGEVIDSNGDGVGDALRGRAACLELSNVTRFRIYAVRLEVFFAETWQTVALDDQDAVSANRPADIRWYTPVPGFCSDIRLIYRVRQTVGIRWADGTAGTHSVVSDQFQARGVANTQVC